MYRSDRRLAVVLVAPAILIMLAVFIYPMVISFYQSLTDLSLVQSAGSAKFIGFANYVRAVTDAKTLNSLWLTASFTIITVGLELVLGTIAAIILFEYKGFQQNLLRTTIILPMMTSSIVVGLIWRLMYNADYGVFNAILESIHLPPQFWLGPGKAFWSIVLTEIWQNTPFVTLLVLAGLTSLPEEPFEAAEIDGASYWQRLVYLTLPLLTNVYLVIILFRTMFALRSIETVWILTGGGPADETMLFGLQVYRTAFSYFDVGYSNALAWILLLVMAVLTAVFYRTMRRSPEQ